MRNAAAWSGRRAKISDWDRGTQTFWNGALRQTRERQWGQPLCAPVWVFCCEEGQAPSLRVGLQSSRKQHLVTFLLVKEKHSTAVWLYKEIAL